MDVGKEKVEGVRSCFRTKEVVLYVSQKLHKEPIYTDRINWFRKHVAKFVNLFSVLSWDEKNNHCL